MWRMPVGLMPVREIFFMALIRIPITDGSVKAGNREQVTGIVVCGWRVFACYLSPVP
jgi:hypothetical protein